MMDFPRVAFYEWCGEYKEGTPADWVDVDEDDQPIIKE
jgi:hypothetical protein